MEAEDYGLVGMSLNITHHLLGDYRNVYSKQFKIPAIRRWSMLHDCLLAYTIMIPKSEWYDISVKGQHDLMGSLIGSMVSCFARREETLAKLNMNTDAADMLNEAAQLEEKRRGGRGS
ncbi:unnamed protein product [Arabidopsis halleri]